MGEWSVGERRSRRRFGNGRADLEAAVDRLRSDYQRLYSAQMVENLDRLHEADGRRAASTPSTPSFHAATQDTEEIAADIWEQARRGDRDTPNGKGDGR